MEQETENYASNLFGIITVAIITTVLIVWGVDCGTGEADKNARTAIEKSLRDQDRLVGSFILNDTIIETTKHVKIIDNCIGRDSMFIETTSLPSRYIGVTVGDELGGVKFFCFTKAKFYSVNKGDVINALGGGDLPLIDKKPYYDVVQIANPINCK